VGNLQTPNTILSQNLKYEQHLMQQNIIQSDVYGNAISARDRVL